MIARLDRWALPVLLLLAAALRLPDLATRGTWDGDQGHDMLVLRAFVRDGVIPLLGPPTSIGDVHHGAWYYYLLTPVAAVTGGDSPLAVVAVIALAGVAAVGVVWWLARSIGGPLAGLVAGLVLAISAAAIDESTFIWNPNFIALSSAVSLAGAWRAWQGGTPRWWLMAALGTAVTMQCHVLGVALLPIVGVPFVLDARRRGLGHVGWGVAAIFAVAYLPLAINELTTGFSETRAALEYLGGDRASNAPGVLDRFGIAGLRVVSWPLVGLITAGFLPAVAATAAIVAIIAALWRRGAGPVALTARWFGLALLWSIAFLTVAAPSLATVIPGLPNDHYHAFADPLVVVLVGLGIAAAVQGSHSAGVAVGVAAIALSALIGWNVTHLPPAAHVDGGYPAAERAGVRVLDALRGAGVASSDVVLVRSLPPFKSTEAMAYPLIRAGQVVLAETPKGVAPGSVAVPADGSAGSWRGLVLLCDQLFRGAIGADCGGPAESVVAPDAGGAGTAGSWGPLLVRFEAHPGRWVSVYGPPPTP
ncbi:MAG: ArnT family glycosyltransferase [Candidatus Limnocylindrales bacterium]